MSHRFGTASVAVGALLVCASALVAAEPQSSSKSESWQQSLTKPLYLADSGPADTTIMGLLGKAGASKFLTDNGITIGGYAEVGWSYNFNTPTGNVNPGRVFDFEDQDLTFHQLVVFVDKSVDTAKKTFQVGGRMEWMWGGDARLIHSNGLFDHYGVGNGPDEQFDLTQAYLDLFFPVGNGLTVRVGKFATPIGMEVINPNGNALYSHSYMFGYAIPFTHTGILATYNLTDAISLSAGITRGWEQSLEDNNGCSIDVLASLSWQVNKDLKAIINFSGGPQRAGASDDYRYLLDVVVTYKLGDKLTLGLNADYAWEKNAGTSGQDASWYGIAVYAGYKLNDFFALNLRGEWFEDPDGARGLGTFGSVYEVTFGVDIAPFADKKNLAAFHIRPEVRFDYSSDDFFDGGTKNNQITFGIDAIFSF